jgi:hypothetical protein
MQPPFLASTLCHDQLLLMKSSQDLRNADNMTNDSNYKFVCYMDLAMDPVPVEESAMDDFAVCLLMLLGYVP